MSLASISFRSACQRWTTRALLSLVKKKWVAVRQSTTSTFTPPSPPLNYYYNMKYFKRWTTTRKKENSKSNNATVIRRSRVEKNWGIGREQNIGDSKISFFERGNKERKSLKKAPFVYSEAQKHLQAWDDQWVDDRTWEPTCSAWYLPALVL